MIAAILKIFSVLKGLLDIVKYVQEYLAAKKRARDEKRNQEREKAIEDSKKAKTDEEIWRSQEEIVKNQPQP